MNETAPLYVERPAAQLFQARTKASKRDDDNLHLDRPRRDSGWGQPLIQKGGTR